MRLGAGGWKREAGSFLFCDDNTKFKEKRKDFDCYHFT